MDERTPNLDQGRQPGAFGINPLFKAAISNDRPPLRLVVDEQHTSISDEPAPQELDHVESPDAELLRLRSEKKQLQYRAEAAEALAEKLGIDVEKLGIDSDTGALNKEGLSSVLGARYGISHTNPEFANRRAETARSKKIVLLVGDVCELKRVNDAPGMGHTAGDAMLRRTVEILRDGLLRESDIVARTGGDEFLVIIELSDDMSDEQIADFVAKKRQELEAVLSKPRNKDISDYRAGEVVDPIVAWGAAWGNMTDLTTYKTSLDTPGDEELTTYHQLLQAADKGMYTRKRELKEAGLVITRDSEVPDPTKTALMRRVSEVYARYNLPPQTDPEARHLDVAA